MSENRAELQVRDFFEIHGFHVERICAAENEKRADYLVKDNSSSYLVEVKGRVEDERHMEKLMRDGIASKEEVVGRTNPVSKQIREAAEQLQSDFTSHDGFQIIALVAEGHDPPMQATQFESTIYGKVELITEMKDGEARTTPCFYFTYNEFYNLRHMDAALILFQTGAKGYSKLCVNNFSPRSREFQLTRLYKSHNEHEAICDPRQLEKINHAFIADCNLDRHDEAQILEYVKQKYKLDFALTFHPKKYTVSKIVDDQNNDS